MLLSHSMVLVFQSTCYGTRKCCRQRLIRGPVPPPQSRGRVCPEGNVQDVSVVVDSEFSVFAFPQDVRGRAQTAAHQDRNKP